MSGSTTSRSDVHHDHHRDPTVPVPATVAVTPPHGAESIRSTAVRSPGDPTGAQPLGHPDEPVRFGRYRLLHRLGEGGMGVVHLGLDEHGRAVAIKVLRDHVAGDAQARNRLAREVSSLSRVHHEGVAPVLDADVDGSRPYLVTKYVPGPTLDEWVRRHGPLQGAALVAFASGLSDALAAIHAAGVVHRDVKPGNVLMRDGAPVLIDFGIAHLADEARLTVSGLVMGTPGYLPPELLGGRPVSEATDWWGWAATLAYAATGRAPFGAGGMDAVLHRTLAGECDLRDVDPRLAPLLRAALDPVPERRPDRPVVLAALAAYAAGQDTTRCLPAASSEAATDRGVNLSPPTRTSVHRLPPTSALPAAAVPAPPTPPAGYAGFGSPVRPAPDPEPRPAPHVPDPVRGAPPPLSPSSWRPGAGSWADLASQPPAPRHPGRGSDNDPQGVVPAARPWGVVPGSEPSGVLPAGPSELPDTGGPVPGAAADPRIGRRARTGTLAALALAVAALATALPVAAVLSAVCWSALARTADRSVTAMTMRRIERGPRGRDVPLAIVASPVHLVTGMFSAVLTALLPLVLGMAAAFGAAVVTGGAGPDPTAPLPLAGGMVVAILTAWWGIGGTSLRRGSRSLVRGLAPGRVGAAIVSALLVVLAAYLAVRSQATGAAADWWPLRNNPFEGLTLLF